MSTTPTSLFMWYKQSSVFCRSVSWEELYLRLEPPSRGEAALSLQMFSWLGCIFIDAFDEDDSIYNNFRSSNAFALIFYCFLLGGYFCRSKQCFPRFNEILELTRIMKLELTEYVLLEKY